jgi:hypothetical protein
VGDVSGGAFNPAVGIALPGCKAHFEDMWIYIVGPLLGGALQAAAGKLHMSGAPTPTPTPMPDLVWPGSVLIHGCQPAGALAAGSFYLCNPHECSTI